MGFDALAPSMRQPGTRIDPTVLELAVALSRENPDRTRRAATLVPQAAAALAGEHAERGRTPIVVLDEADLLDITQFEAVRMLTNHDMDELTNPQG